MIATKRKDAHVFPVIERNSEMQGKGQMSWSRSPGTSEQDGGVDYVCSIHQTSMKKKSFCKIHIQITVWYR